MTRKSINNLENNKYVLFIILILVKLVLTKNLERFCTKKAFPLTLNNRFA